MYLNRRSCPGSTPFEQDSLTVFCPKWNSSLSMPN